MNNLTKTHNFFRAIMYLSKGRYYAATDLARDLDIEPRTVYRYIEELDNSPIFEVQRRGKRIRISADSVFWRSVTDAMYLTDDEAIALGRLLDQVEVTDDVLKAVQRKVQSVVSNSLALDVKDPEGQLAQNIAQVRRAVEEQRLCLLRGYDSLHSNTKTDRLVEPFSFLGSKNDVRCYELSTQCNKTFKISRCESVEVLDVGWQFERRHKQMYTDIFHFSDEKTTRVRLVLGHRSKTILLEEHPEAKSHLISYPDGRWLLDAEFCSMKGIGRFYLGLFEDIEILDSPEFKDYLTERSKVLTEHVNLLTLEK